MRKSIFLTFGLFLSLTVLGQNPTNSGNLADGFKIMRQDSKGSPFLTEKWHVGYGVLEDGSTTRPQQLNYDIHGNNLVYKVAGSNKVLKLLDESLSGFILKKDEDELIFTKINGSEFEKTKEEDKYYQIVEAPSRNVVIEYVKKFDDPNNSGWTSSNNNTLSAEYKLNTDYYVLNGNNKYEKVKLKNNSALKVFKDKKKELSSFISKKKIDIDTPEDLLEVADYYHSL